jgi:hypothetical protein
MFLLNCKVERNLRMRLQNARKRGNGSMQIHHESFWHLEICFDQTGSRGEHFSPSGAFQNRDSDTWSHS